MRTKTCTTMQVVHRIFVLARVHHQFTRVSQPEHRIAILFCNLFFQQCDAIVATAQFVQTSEFGDQKIDIVRVLFQKRIGRSKQIVYVRVVTCQRSRRPQRQAMLGVDLAHLLNLLFSLLAIVSFQRQVNLIGQIKHGCVRKLDPFQAIGLIGGNQRHPTGATRCVMLQHLFGFKFVEMPFARITHDDRLSITVVSNHGLQMAASRIDRCQRKRNPRIDQLQRNLPSQPKLTSDESFVFCPTSLAMSRCSVKTNFVHDLQVLNWVLPVIADGRKCRGRAGQSILTNKLHGQNLTFACAVFFAQFFGKVGIERRVGFLGMLAGCRKITTVISRVGAASRQPLWAFSLQMHVGIEFFQTIVNLACLSVLLCFQ